MSTIITPWGWFQLGKLTQLKTRVTLQTFNCFMDRLPDAYKGEVQWSHGKDNYRIIVIQQLYNWTGWDHVRHAMELAKANVIVQKGLARLAELTKDDMPSNHEDAVDHVAW